MGSASFENSETEFRYSRCNRQGGVEASVWPSMCCGKAEEKWRAKGWGHPSVDSDDGHVLRGMVRAGNYWLFSDNREKFICTVNDIIEELLDLDMEPKAESLQWIRTHKQEDMGTLCVGSSDRAWDLPFCEVFDVPGYRYHRDGKGFQGAERTRCKGLRSWWRD